jgi:hypothetical protein
LSRIRTIAFLAVMAALAALLLSACGGGGGSEEPQKVIESASFKGIDSGKLEAKVSLVSKGQKSGNVEVDLSGPFQAGEKGSLPQFALQASVTGNLNGKNVDFEGGLTVLSDRAFVGYKGTEYEVDPTTFSFLKSGFEQAQQKEGESAGDVTACQEAATGVELADIVENLKSEGSADVAGTSTTKVSGDLSVDGAVEVVEKLAEDPACSAQLEAAGPLPLNQLKKAKGELGSAIKRSHIDVYVGDDHIIRKLDIEFTVEPEPSEGSVEVAVEATVSEVNEEQEIEAPSGAEPLEKLFQELGVNPLELLENGSGGIGGLIEGLGDQIGGLNGLGGGSSSGGSSSGAAGGGGDQQKYVECLQEAETPTDLQKCASLLQ